MLALFSLAAVSTTPLLAQSKVLQLRGGLDLGPINADNTGGLLKVAAAVTAAGAMFETHCVCLLEILPTDPTDPTDSTDSTDSTD